MEMNYMIKQMAWNTFKNTGDINTFLELKEVQNIEKQNIEKVVIKAEQYGDIEDKRDNNIGKQYE